MIATFLIQLLLLLLIVLVNIYPLDFPVPIAPIPASIALAIVSMVHLYIKLKSISIPSDKKPVEKEVEHEVKEPMDSSFEIDNCKTLIELINQAKDIAKDKDNIEQLSLELDTYRQCYMWVQNMEKTYGRPWRETIQGAEMPIKAELYPQIRKMMMEISLHTIDFCRYRTNYVNLTPLMMVNPMMILLGKDAKGAGAVPISMDPYETDREARVLYSLIKYDGISLKDATIHGYYVPKELENEEV